MRKLSKFAQGHTARSHIASIPTQACFHFIHWLFKRENPSPRPIYPLSSSHGPTSYLCPILCLPCTFLPCFLHRSALYSTSLGSFTSNSNSHTFPHKCLLTQALQLVSSARSPSSNYTSSSSMDSVRPLHSSHSEKTETPASGENWTCRHGPCPQGRR